MLKRMGIPIFAVLVLLILISPPASAHSRWSFGVSVGGPVYYSSPYVYSYPYYPYPADYYYTYPYSYSYTYVYPRYRYRYYTTYSGPPVYRHHRWRRVYYYR